MKRSAYIERLCKLMVQHGITELKVGEVVLVRPPFAAFPKEEQTSAQEERDEFERLKGMSPDKQDRALRLDGLGPMGSG